MSAIDNAFIRAYTTDAAAAAAPAIATANPRSKPMRVAATTASALPKTEVSKANGRASVAENPSATPGRPHFARSAPRANAATSVIPAPHINLAMFSHSATTLDPPRQAPIPVRIDPPAVAIHAPHTVSTSPGELAAPANEIDETPTTLPISVESATETAPRRPAYEVDRFAWSETCDALLARIGVQADELAQELMAEAALGRKVIALSGCSRDDGGTTLALVLARRLAASGAKVALVDADFAGPQLAGRLGLVIGIGWETVLALPGKTALWETMVESIDDRLTVVPLASRSRLHISGEIAARLTNCLADLREAFDIVLVDAGPMSAADAEAAWLTASGNGLDAAILVCDVRSTQADGTSVVADRVASVSRRLMDSNIAPLGVAENFCA
jgi:Mrp family chromosome partitioning ATPase